MSTLTKHPRIARRWAEVYRGRGYQPLPSRMDAKRPMCRFAEWWESEAPADLFDRFETTNIQIMTGRHWRLAVLDLDGREAIGHVKTWRPLPRTWVTGTGGGGQHWWFSLPDGLEPKGKTILWQGAEKHSAIELLVDRCLVIAPPSIHPTTGAPYRFLDTRHWPFSMMFPAMLPQWLWEKEAVRPDIPERPVLPVSPRTTPQRTGQRPDRGLVLSAIPDKIALARSWGLRFARREMESGGWVSVHDFNRDDVHPSARFNVNTGQFWRPGELPMSLFDVGVALGAYRDWQEARDDLSVRYGVA